MATWVLDANVLIYALTDHPEFAPRVRALFQEAKSTATTLFVPVAVMAEVLYVLEGSQFGYTAHEATGALERVIITAGIDCQDGEAVLFGLRRHRDSGLDFVDGYCAGLAKSSGSILVTHDQKIGPKTGVMVRGLE